MTDYRSMYDKDYIGAWDLDGGDMTITMTRCTAGQLVGQGGRKAKKPIVYFAGSEKGFALNATNGKTIAAMYGNQVEEWKGKRIALYKSSTRNPNGDGEVECIRVRPTIPAAGTESAAPVQQSARVDDDVLIIKGREWAESGTQKYAAWWNGLTKEQRNGLGTERHTQWKEIASRVPA